MSVALSTPNDQSDISRTLTVMQWAQFIANDISYTPMRKMGKWCLIFSLFLFLVRDLQMRYAFNSIRSLSVAVSSGKPISCCRPDGNPLSPRYVHPDCSPITVPDRDPVYGQHYVRCMNYVRSLPVLKSECTFGPAEQASGTFFFFFIEHWIIIVGTR